MTCVVAGVGIPVSHGLVASHGGSLVSDAPPRSSALIPAPSSSAAFCPTFKSLAAGAPSPLTFPRLPLGSLSALDSSLLGAAQQVSAPPLRLSVADLLTLTQYVTSLTSSSAAAKSGRLRSPSPPASSSSSRVDAALGPSAYASASLLSPSLASSLSDGLSASSLASWFLHPAALGYPWTINLMAASHYRYAAPPLPFSAAPLGVGSSFSPQPAADLADQRNISIADLRLKAKRHAEALGLDDKST